MASSSGWWLAERIVLLAATLAVNVVLSRSLGPAGYGELSYLLAIVALLLPLGQFGLSGLVARAVLERPDQQQGALRAALLWRAIGCVVALVLGLVYWAWMDPRPSDRAVLIVLLLAQSATVFQALEFWFQAHLQANALVPWRTAVVLAVALLKMIVALATRDAVAVAWCFALEYVLLGLAYAAAYRRVGGAWLLPAWNREWFGWFARRSPWLLLSGVAEVLYLKIDVVMLERLQGVEAAGVYSVAARLSEIWYVLPVVLAGSLFPALWNRRSVPESYRRGLQQGFDVLFACAFAIAVLMQFVAGPLVRVLFGEHFDASSAVLVVHVWAGVFVFMRALLSRWLIAEDLLRFSLVTHLAGAIVNVLLNLALIPRFGPLGAAWATVISYATAGWLALSLSASTRPIGLMMAKALLLPVRWKAIAGYSVRLRGLSSTPR